MVNNPNFYAPVMTLLSFRCYIVLIISSVSGIVNVMCLVVVAAACLLILGSLGTVRIAQ